VHRPPTPVRATRSRRLSRVRTHSEIHDEGVGVTAGSAAAEAGARAQKAQLQIIDRDQGPVYTKRAADEAAPVGPGFGTAGATAVESAIEAVASGAANAAPLAPQSQPLLPETHLRPQRAAAPLCPE
jgi:hypothetical protein